MHGFCTVYARTWLLVLADSELLTADDHFDLLVKYVHEEANMKEVFLERIARDPEK